MSFQSQPAISKPAVQGTSEYRYSNIPTRHSTGLKPMGLALLGGTMFYALFWEESLGINFTLWGLLLALYLSARHPQLHTTRQGILALAAVGIALVETLLIDSDLAFITSIAALLFLAGTAQAADQKTAPWALLIVGFSRVFQRSLRWCSRGIAEAFIYLGADNRLLWLSRGTWLIPIGIVVLFLILFSAASPIFGGLVGEGIEGFASFIGRLIGFQTIGKAVVIGIGTLICAGFLMQRSNGRLITWVARQRDTVQHPDPLNEEKLYAQQRTAEFTLLGINLLLLLYNVIDINWIWFNFYLPQGTKLYQLVHEGTYYLIASTLISMGVILDMFHGPQHFNRRNRWLRWGCYAWLAQNAVLVISVAVRNYRYIADAGLAYKRIGVIFFLVLTLFGLVTVALKIQRGFSLAWLLRTNSWAVAALWLCAAGISWDRTIARYNLTYVAPSRMDIAFLYSLSDHTLPILWEKKELFELDCFFTNPKWVGYATCLGSRIKSYREYDTADSWLSFDFATARTQRQLRAIPASDLAPPASLIPTSPSTP